MGESSGAPPSGHVCPAIAIPGVSSMDEPPHDALYVFARAWLDTGPPGRVTRAALRRGCAVHRARAERRRRQRVYARGVPSGFRFHREPDRARQGRAARGRGAARDGGAVGRCRDSRRLAERFREALELAELELRALKTRVPLLAGAATTAAPDVHLGHGRQRPLFARQRTLATEWVVLSPCAVAPADPACAPGFVDLLEAPAPIAAVIAPFAVAVPLHARRARAPAARAARPRPAARAAAAELAGAVRRRHARLARPHRRAATAARRRTERDPLIDGAGPRIAGPARCDVTPRAAAGCRRTR